MSTRLSKVWKPETGTITCLYEFQETPSSKVFSGTYSAPEEATGAAWFAKLESYCEKTHTDGKCLVELQGMTEEAKQRAAAEAVAAEPAPAEPASEAPPSTDEVSAGDPSAVATGKKGKATSL